MAAWARRTFLAFAAIFLLSAALFVAGCGGGGSTTDSASTEPSTGTTPSAQAPIPDRGSASEGGAQSSPAGKSGGSDRDEAPPPPKTHNDSGGGSAQFRVPGGDNSVQEFGEEGSESELQRAAVALHGFFDARAARSWEAACGYLAASVTQTLDQLAAADDRLEGKECGQILEALSGRASDSVLAEAAEADVGSLRLEGEEAFLIYRGAGGVTYAVPVLREQGEWKMGAMTGTPLG